MTFDILKPNLTGDGQQKLWSLLRSIANIDPTIVRSLSEIKAIVNITKRWVSPNV